MRCVRSVALVVVSHGAAGQDSPCLLGCLCHPGEEILPLAEVSLHHQAHVLLVYALTYLISSEICPFGKSPETEEQLPARAEAEKCFKPSPDIELTLLCSLWSSL